MTRRDDPRTAAARVFAEGGAFGELLSGIDWAATPLGPPVSWPGPLVDTLRLMLTSEHGMALYWGAEFATLYNSGSTPIVGAKHPWALGRPYKEVFPEVWAHPVSSHFHYVTDTRKPLLVPNELLIMERHGFLEQCYFDSAFQPVLLDDGTAGGVLQILTETTGRVLGERRLRLLSETGTRTAGRAAHSGRGRPRGRRGGGLLPRRDPVSGPVPGFRARDAAAGGLHRAPVGARDRLAECGRRAGGGGPAGAGGRRRCPGHAAGRRVHRRQHGRAARRGLPAPGRAGAGPSAALRGPGGGRAGGGRQPLLPPGRGLLRLPGGARLSCGRGAVGRARARRAAQAGGGAGRARPGQDHLLRQRQPRVPHPTHPAPGPAPAGPGRRGPARAARAAGAGRARRPAPAEAGQHPPGRRPCRGRADAPRPRAGRPRRCHGRAGRGVPVRLRGGRADAGGGLPAAAQAGAPGPGDVGEDHPQPAQQRPEVHLHRRRPGAGGSGRRSGKADRDRHRHPRG
ncbi:UNVERIFIED_CONTAM: hypothetical protein RKD50_002995 [Streptomyces canus]